MPCKHVQILPGTQLLRKIMLCKMPPVITFDVYFYHKCFAMFYYKYYKLNLPFIFFTKWVVGRLTSMFYLSWRCWAFSFPFFIETFLVGPYSFQAKEGCILANLELVKAITKLEKFFFLCSSSGNSSGGSYVIKEYLWIDPFTGGNRWTSTWNQRWDTLLSLPGSSYLKCVHWLQKWMAY